MKTQNSIKVLLTLTIALIITTFSNVIAFAQDVPEKVDVNISADGGTAWYGQPWIWIVGVAVFILILVIITRSNKSSEA